jgi:hypothetical protein
LLPTFDAVAAMPWEGASKENPGGKDTQIDTQDLGPEGHSVAQSGIENGEHEVKETAATQGESPALAPAVT